MVSNSKLGRGDPIWAVLNEPFTVPYCFLRFTKRVPFDGLVSVNRSFGSASRSSVEKVQGARIPTETSES